MSKLSHSNPNLDDVLHAGNAHRALGKKYPPLPEVLPECCARCGEDDFSPSVEAFEMSGEICCENCADEIFEECGQFGVGA